MWAVGPKARRLRALHERAPMSYRRGSAAAAERLAAAVAGIRTPLRVLVEIDSGGRRTGVADAETAVRVADASRRLGLEVVGVFSHAGHAYAGPEGGGSPPLADEAAIPRRGRGRNP